MMSKMLISLVLSVFFVIDSNHGGVIDSSYSQIGGQYSSGDTSDYPVRTMVNGSPPAYWGGSSSFGPPPSNGFYPSVFNGYPSYQAPFYNGYLPYGMGGVNPLNYPLAGDNNYKSGGYGGNVLTQTGVNGGYPDWNVYGTPSSTSLPMNIGSGGVNDYVTSANTNIYHPGKSVEIANQTMEHTRSTMSGNDGNGKPFFIQIDQSSYCLSTKTALDDGRVVIKQGCTENGTKFIQTARGVIQEYTKETICLCSTKDNKARGSNRDRLVLIFGDQCCSHIWKYEQSKGFFMESSESSSSTSVLAMVPSKLEDNSCLYVSTLSESSSRSTIMYINN